MFGCSHRLALRSGGAAKRLTDESSPRSGKWVYDLKIDLQVIIIIVHKSFFI